MKVIDHGKWIPYKPAKDDWPEDAPPNAMFCKRESDGVDWYQYVNPKKDSGRIFSENFQEDSVKIAFMFHEVEQQWIIGPSVTDATMLFPAHHYVREITDFGSTDEEKIIAAFRNKAIDPGNNRMSERLAVVGEDSTASLTQRLIKLEAIVTQLIERMK